MHVCLCFIDFAPQGGSGGSESGCSVVESLGGEHNSGGLPSSSTADASVLPLEDGSSLPNTMGQSTAVQSGMMSYAQYYFLV